MMVVRTTAAWSFLAFGFILFVVQLAAHEVGFWIGRRQAAQREAAPVARASAPLRSGACSGLLAFVLALTLSFASERFNSPCPCPLAEANAIGTAWLRAKAIEHPRGDEIARLLEQYIKVRTAFVQASHFPAELQDIIFGKRARFNQRSGDILLPSFASSPIPSRTSAKWRR